MKSYHEVTNKSVVEVRPVPQGGSNSCPVRVSIMCIYIYVYVYMYIYIDIWVTSYDLIV